jgi:hypothetical protein
MNAVSLYRTIAREAGLKPILIPVPFAAWQALAWIAEKMPSPPITRNQVELMQVDNVSSAKSRGPSSGWYRSFSLASLCSSTLD